MAPKVFCIWLLADGIPTVVYDLSQWSFFTRSTIKDFIGMIALETIQRAQPPATVDFVLQAGELLGSNSPACVGSIHDLQNAALVFTLDAEWHNHLIVLANKLVLRGVIKDPPAANFDLIASELKIADLRLAIEETKLVMYNNIEMLLKREEKLDDLIAKTEHLTTQSKRFYRESQRLNRCCFFF